MLDNAYLLLGLAAALLYAFAASVLKMVTERGVGSVYLALIANVAATVGFAIVFLPWGSGLLPADWWPSVVVGVLFAAGQLFTVLSLQRGHASIATPTLGSKVVLVPILLAVGFGQTVPNNVIVAALLTTIGIVVLAWPSEHLPWSKVIPAVALSFAAAVSFAFFDVLVQLWSPRVTFGLLMPWALFVASVVTAGYIALTQRPWPTVPKPARKTLALGVTVLTVQALLFIGSIGTFNDAAGLNVVYGSRGLFSVVMVWLVGHHFSKHERFHNRKQLVMRLIGATLIAAAVAMVFLGN